MEARKKILIVDDEAAVRQSLELLLKTNFEVLPVENGLEALEAMDRFQPDLVLLDVMMPKLDGIETLKKLRESHGKIPVVMLTATNTVRTAVQAMKHGAVDYLSKPFEIDELTNLIVTTLDDSVSASFGQRRRAGRSATLEGDFGLMVGASQSMASLFTCISQIAEKDSTVLITGESGTGKELVAKEVHNRSNRRTAPFIALNCAAIPETLIESELFGHEKGSFTSATETKMGQFELADGGTLFLDEIGELSHAVQVKMLRFLQEQEFYRLGKSKPIRVDVRIIAATNKNLEDLIVEKKFRQDLFYRINVINLGLPPLRDRHEDIPRLAEFFVKKLSPAYEGKQLNFMPDALETMIQYPWPGNVRELENVIECLMALSPTTDIGRDDLPRKLLAPIGGEALKPTSFQGSVRFEEAEKLFETEMIMKALRKTNFVQTRAAELLGISRRILKYKMDKLGITESLSGELKAE